MSRSGYVTIAVAVVLWIGVVAWSRFSQVPTPDDETSPTATLMQYTMELPEPIDGGEYPAAEAFLLLNARDQASRLAAANQIEKHWHIANVAPILEGSRLMQRLSSRQIQILEERTGTSFGGDTHQWYDYLWNQPYEPHPHLASFKSALYARIDPRFVEYFDDKRPATIRLDEILWGGVVRDGIPPLKNPEMLSAQQADYLEDSNVVFGISINGDARAYPKRILAWHEMFKDTVGGISINGAYCTLCGSMIVYDTKFNGVHHELGTSGFLYRSNKLMYDHATKSMWSTLTGEPVVGPLVGQGIKLKRLHVVTTTWGEWRRRHPETTVLSLRTGHRRDYGEGVAYRRYFATDQLMFRVPFHDRRLKNKQEVVALRFDDQSEPPLAIDTAFLNENTVHHDSIGTQRLVVLTDPTGANRVYDPGEVRFERWDGNDRAIDADGGTWQVSEAGLTSSDGTVLPRLPSHRAFWFGWHAAFPNTRLVGG